MVCEPWRKAPDMAGLQLENVLIDRLWARNVVVAHEACHGIAVNVGRAIGVSAQCF